MAAKRPAPKPDAARYGWLADESRPFPKPVDTLAERFTEPSGYERVPLEPGSFGHWLRYLPLAAPSTPVVTHEGEVAVPGDDPYVAAVVAIDVGTEDLQHGPDVVIRLHAEWVWAMGNRDELGYRSSATLDLPLARFLKGERVSAKGGSPEWLPLGKPGDPGSHEDFRDYLDSVFNWVNSRSLMTQAERPEPSDVRPGDFIGHEGKPAEAVVILDVARDRKRGRTLVLLGRALDPAQSIHVVSIGAKIPWFEISPPTPLLTPRTAEFAWDGLRRLSP